MISLLRGTIISIELRSATIDVSGVGYEVYCSHGCLETLEISRSATVVIYTDVKEDSITLYGSKDLVEKQVFLLLKRVKGVGSRTASDILSRIDKLELLRAIGSGDIAKLQSVKRVGKKLAERLVVELKELVSQFALESRASKLEIEVLPLEPYRDAFDALRSLGFAAVDAERALSSVRAQGLAESIDSAGIIREALKYV